MKLERPEDRSWPGIMIIATAIIAVFILLFYNEIGIELIKMFNFVNWTLEAVALTAMVISYRDNTLFSEAEQKSQEAVRVAEKKASALEAEKIHLEHQVESVAVELQHLKEKHNSLQDEVQDLQRDNATLQRENIALILNSAQRIAALNSRITELKLKKGASQ